MTGTNVCLIAEGEQNKMSKILTMITLELKLLHSFLKIL